MMTRAFGVLVTLCVLTACGDTQKNDNGANGPGAGGTTTQGSTSSTAQSSTGTTTQASATGTTAQGQGGTATASTVVGTTGSGADGGGGAGTAGAGTAGAAGAAAACEEQCYGRCREGTVPAECNDQGCVCEPVNTPHKPVYQDLLACNLDEPCPSSVYYDDHVNSTWDDGACLLEALRDRTRGRFHHTNSEVEDGVYTTDYVFLLGGDDDVLMLRATVDFVGVRDYLPVWSCTLKSYDDLDACVAAGTDASAPSVCDATEDWFEACQAIENPQCPGE